MFFLRRTTMEGSALAIVEIDFQSQTLEESDIRAIEVLLRQDQNANNFSIRSGKIKFFVWRKKEVDFKLLDRIKEELRKRGKTDFVISANEFLKTYRKYYYVAEEPVASS